MDFLKSIFSINIPERRIFGLDIIRAVAILIVVYQHGASVFPAWAQRYYDFLKVDGVTIFFVLSGFLIGKILIKTLENRQGSFADLLHFWCRRWFRTLPVFYITLIIAAVTYPFLRPDIPVEQLGAFFVFFQNFATPHPKFNGVAWSLSVEEWFYLVIPAMLFGLAALRQIRVRHAILLVSFVVLLFSFGFRHQRFFHLAIDSYQEWTNLFRMQVITRMDSIIIGLIGAYIFSYHRLLWDKKKQYALWLGLTIFLVTTLLKLGHIYPSYGYYSCVLSFQVEALGTLLILPFFNTLNGKKNLFCRAVTLVSLVSYSAYLVHATLVLELVVHRVDWFQIVPVNNLNILVKYISYLTLTLLTSVLFYTYLELPLRNIRESKWIINALYPNGRPGEE
jgi:peptidoglycan/LPS O-acetylase OafA/YrhL